MKHIVARLNNARKMHFNLIKTIYFCFKVFKFKEAMKLPVWLYGQVQFDGIKRGCIDVLSIKSGGVRIGGGKYTDIFGNSRRFKSYLRIQGKIVLGTDVTLLQGITLSVNSSAVISIGNNVVANENVTIHAKESITICDNCRIGWNTHILDTNFHYMLTDGNLTYRNEPIFIDHNVWLANGCSVMKGSRLPAYSVVASGSLVNKDFTQYGEHCLFGETPAKLIRKGVERILVKESSVDSLFANRKDVICWESVKDTIDASES